MPKQTKQGTRSSGAAENKQASAPEPSRPALYLQTLAGPPLGGPGYILRDRFREWWGAFRQWIEGDIQRIRAHSTANYDEQTRTSLLIDAEDAESTLRHMNVLVELLEERLEYLEDNLGTAQETAEEAEAKMKKGRSRKGSKRTD